MQLNANIVFTLFFQWSSQELGTCSGDTICSAGCAMTSVAMMLATKGVSVNPSSLDSWLTSNGGYASGCLIVWAPVDAFGVSSFQGIETVSSLFTMIYPP